MPDQSITSDRTTTHDDSPLGRPNGRLKVNIDKREEHMSREDLMEAFSREARGTWFNLKTWTKSNPKTAMAVGGVLMLLLGRKRVGGITKLAASSGLLAWAVKKVFDSQPTKS